MIAITLVAVTVHSLVFSSLISSNILLDDERDEQVNQFENRAFFAITAFSIFIEATKVFFFL